MRPVKQREQSTKNPNRRSCVTCEHSSPLEHGPGQLRNYTVGLVGTVDPRDPSAQATGDQSNKMSDSDSFWSGVRGTRLASRAEFRRWKLYAAAWVAAWIGVGVVVYVATHKYWIAAIVVGLPCSAVAIQDFWRKYDDYERAWRKANPEDPDREYDQHDD